jgi:hypothetical protein
MMRGVAWARAWRLLQEKGLAEGLERQRGGSLGALRDALPDSAFWQPSAPPEGGPMGADMGMLIPGCVCPMCGTPALREGRCHPVLQWLDRPVWFLQCAACTEIFRTEEMELYGELIEWLRAGRPTHALPQALLRAFQDLCHFGDPYAVLRRRLAQRETALAAVPPVFIDVSVVSEVCQAPSGSVPS